jgi:hypothetical protein
MESERDYLPIILGLLGLISVGYAIFLNLQETTGKLFYVLIVFQAFISIYLLYVVVSALKEAWTDYRWSPDRLR